MKSQSNNVEFHSFTDFALQSYSLQQDVSYFMLIHGSFQKRK